MGRHANRLGPRQPSTGRTPDLDAATCEDISRRSAHPNHPQPLQLGLPMMFGDAAQRMGGRDPCAAMCSTATQHHGGCLSVWGGLEDAATPMRTHSSTPARRGPGPTDSRV